MMKNQKKAKRRSVILFFLLKFNTIRVNADLTDPDDAVFSISVLAPPINQQHAPIPGIVIYNIDRRAPPEVVYDAGMENLTHGVNRKLPRLVQLDIVQWRGNSTGGNEDYDQKFVHGCRI